MDKINILSSVPAFQSLTAIPENGLIAYLWSDTNETTLRIHNPKDETIESVSIDGFNPRGHEQLLWTGEKFIADSRPETYLVDRDGTAEEILPEDEHTLVHDVSPNGRYVFYTHYEKIRAETWPLKRYDREEETTVTLTEHPEQWGHAGFSLDGQWIAFRENPEDRIHEGRQVVSTYDGKQKRTFHIENPDSRSQQHGWHPDGERLLVTDRSSGVYRAGLYDWKTDEATWFGPGEYDERSPVITENGAEVLVQRRQEGVDVPIVYPTSGGSGRKLDLANGVLNTAIRYQEDVMVLDHETSTSPGRLLTYDLATDETETLVDTRTEKFDDFDLVDAEHVTYESTDGTSVNAILYQADCTPSPAVVYIHGGPTTAECRDFDPFAQFLVNEGYTVLEPNYRGSTDQDQTFEEMIRGDVGGGEVDDVAEAGRWLADQSWIDEDRMAALGHSHGGYNASMLAVRFSELWQLVCIKNGYLAFSADGANPYTRRRLVADPERESSEEFKRERSAIARVDEIECPICLLYGEQDNVEQAREFAEELKARGWIEGEEYRLEILEGEGHVIDDKERLWNLVADILDEYV